MLEFENKIATACPETSGNYLTDSSDEDCRKSKETISIHITKSLLIAAPVSRKASGESGQNDGGLERGKGHRYFLQKRGARANAVGQNLAARGSAWFAGKERGRDARRPVRQRSLPGDLIFGSFYQEKEQSQPAAIERANVC
ncbi:hypothetical protein [Mucilaginibacter celer]|uniref:Uncharacterized protein n=1 Tax=Mucilaginibacter celer TaxID=2305508 RepID=A0A494W391_9SPHI|nr:hypothetical protein [Mucilaginibacter celer]AYL98018.1 hypothetical protein HYN43_023210 [Mucilaginibacter celer]